MKIKKLFTLLCISSLLFLVGCKNDSKLDGTWICTSASFEDSEIKNGSLTYSFGNANLKDSMPDIKIKNGHVTFSGGKSYKYKPFEIIGEQEIYSYGKNFENKFAYITSDTSLIFREAFDGTMNDIPFSTYIIMTYVKK